MSPCSTGREANAMTGKMESTGRAQQWQERIARHKTSGVSVAKFCQQEGVTTATFYWWRSQLGKQVEAVACERKTPAAFVELGTMPTTVADRGGMSIRLDLPGGMVLTISRI